jgi:hypothetical protein
MNDLIHGATAILNGLEYHAENYLGRQKTLEKINSNNPKHRATIDMLNHEAIAYFNRIGQLYYFTRSEKVTEIIDNYESHIPNILRLIIFRMKQSAHRATDAPRGENAGHMEQLDRMFTYQYLLVDNKLCHQILLDEPDPITNKQSINFFMHEEHPKLVAEIEKFILELSN